MKKPTYFLVVCLLFVGCKHQISRIRYSVNTQSPTYVDCNITIKKFETIPDSVATKIGKVKLSDSGFSMHCSEEDAMVILKKEGCALNADFVNIIKESRPDSVSNCYRCSAEFYKYTK
jgi:hypothetical protein